MVRNNHVHKSEKVSFRKKKLFKQQEFFVGLSGWAMYIRTIRRSGVKAWFRSTYFGRELVWRGKRYMFTLKKNRKSLKHLFLYGLVKKDAKKYLSKHPIKRPVPFLPSVHWNANLRKSKRNIVGIDLDNAYWQIARNMKVISENTFNHGFRVIDNKMLTLSTLSSLGADKRYIVLKDGIKTNQVEIISGDEQLKRIYLKIRYNCFSYMQQAAALVGNDFVCYRTDCIYFFESKRNIKAISNFFADKGFDYKFVGEWDGVIEDDERY